MSAETICTINAFVNDTAFYSMSQASATPSSTSKNAYTSVNQGYCCADDAISTYFKNPVAITPAVGSVRLGLANLIRGRGTLAGRLNGTLSLHLDGDESLSDARWLNVFDDQATIADLFKAIELVGYAHKYSSANNGSYTLLTVSELDAALEEMFTTDVDTSSYPESAPHIDASGTYTADSSGSDSIPVAQTIEGTTTGTVPVRVRRNATIYLTKTIGEASVKFVIHLFFQKAYFLDNYPNAIITDVICPTTPTKLYNFASTFPTRSDFVSDSTKYTSERMHLVMAGENHSGVYTITTKYNCVSGTTSTGVNFDISFSVVYKGHKPSYSQAIKAIRDVLEEEIPDENGWKQRLPGLYYQVTWYMAPLFNHQYRLNNTSSGSFPSNIYRVNNLEEIARNALTASKYDDSADYLELIKTQHCDYLIVSVPDVNNDIEFKYLSDLFPACTGRTNATISASNANSSLDTAFDQALNKALLVAEDYSPANKAATTPGVEYVVDDDGAGWAMFSCNEAQVFVLTKNSLLVRAPVSVTEDGGPSLP